jgi:hypothetical protein
LATLPSHNQARCRVARQFCTGFGPRPQLAWGRVASWDHDIAVRSLQQTREVDTFAWSSFPARASSHPRRLPCTSLPTSKTASGAPTLAGAHRPSSPSRGVTDLSKSHDRAPARRISSTRCHRRSRTHPGKSAPAPRRPEAYPPIADPAKDRRWPMSLDAFRRRHLPQREDRSSSQTGGPLTVMCLRTGHARERRRH